MKKRVFLTGWMALLLSVAALAQYIPGGISYQAVARETGGDEIVGQNLTIRISILRDSPSGPLLLEEIHDVVTNDFGLFSIVIGQGIQTGNGTFLSLSEIPFQTAPHFIMVEADTPLSVGFEWLGTSELLAVPYAYHAATADSAPEADGDPLNETISDVTLAGTVITITEAGVDHSIDLATGGGAGGGIDPSPTNELITSAELVNDALVIQEGGSTFTVDLSPITGNAGSVTTWSSLAGNGPDAFALTAAHQFIICNVTEDDMVLQLPLASSCIGHPIEVRKYFTGPLALHTLTIETQTGESVDGMASIVFQHPLAEYITLVSDGSAWYLMNHTKAE